MNNQLTHLACIMDGNRRWAQARGLPSFLGHREGLKTLKKVVYHCLDVGIRYVSFYTFSLENLQRPAEEKKLIFDLIAQQAHDAIREAQERSIQIRFVGNRNLFPPSITDICTYIEQSTAMGHRLRVDFLFCYNGQQEITHALQSIVHAFEAQTLPVQPITQALLEQHMWTYDTPPPDLIIRTGDQQRLSAFLLYHAAYAELRFLKCMWPDLTTKELTAVIDDFRTTQRRFGK